MGTCGMSDDETDEELSSPPYKAVRRRRIEWLSEEITNMMHDIDTYTIPVAFGETCGNKPLPRDIQHRAVDCVKMRQPLPGLPVNYYDADFLRRCGTADRLRLDLRKDQPIPSLVRILLVLSIISDFNFC